MKINDSLPGEPNMEPADLNYWGDEIIASRPELRPMARARGRLNKTTLLILAMIVVCGIALLELRYW